MLKHLAIDGDNLTEGEVAHLWEGAVELAIGLKDALGGGLEVVGRLCHKIPNCRCSQMVYENANAFGRLSKAAFCLVGQLHRQRYLRRLRAGEWWRVAPGAKSALANSAFENGRSQASLLCARRQRGR
ncbi:MAG TPA: hypothetical protein VJO34_09910 [Methylomirabilota bacterium]|nr:hypothetical protein [Methylomirabilota bacterium]